MNCRHFECKHYQWLRPREYQGFCYHHNYYVHRLGDCCEYFKKRENGG